MGLNWNATTQTFVKFEIIVLGIRLHLGNLYSLLHFHGMEVGVTLLAHSLYVSGAPFSQRNWFPCQ